ncbi:hypothetical protein ON010_g13073 [Phytophthora cinnamomi]|nr:hypothetical protein ON010_g13073 [Phytophthora cinnamomi]
MPPHFGFTARGSKDTAAYVAKHCFKRQNPVENQAALSLAAFARAVSNTNALPPEITPFERGYRILGSTLYAVTNGQERVHAFDGKPIIARELQVVFKIGDPAQVRMLQKYEAQWQDYYHAQRNDGNDDESIEDQLLRTRSAPTSSWLIKFPRTFLDSGTVTSPDTSTTKLYEDAVCTAAIVSSVVTAISTASKVNGTIQPLPSPLGFTLVSYASQIITPFDEEARFGTPDFLEAFPSVRTRIERLQECYGPVPYDVPPIEPQSTLDTLPPLSENCNDIDDVIGEAFDFPQYQSDPFKIKSQLIAYLGGEAGTVKSTVVEALLALAKRWGREGSVETLAFTGAVAFNIHGKTMHSARNLQLNGAEPNSAPSTEMKDRFTRVVFVVIDDISITNQALLGGTDSVSRSMSTTPNKSGDEVSS